LLTAQQCRTYATEYQRLGQQDNISIQRATALMGLANALEAAAFQLDRLTTIVNEEDK
jgi:hypothetical protein